MKRTLAWCLLSALLAFAAGYALPHAAPRPTTPAPAPAPAGLTEELSEIAARYAASDDAVHKLDLTEAEKEERWESNRRRRAAEMAGARARHGGE